MPIHDLGYRAWEGSPRGAATRWAVIAQTGIRLAWKSHWLRRMMFLSWLPAAALGLFIFMFERSNEEPRLRIALRQAADNMPISNEFLQQAVQNPDEGRREAWAWALLTLFRYPQGFLMLLMVGLLAPPLISQDMQSRAFLLYFSRPIERADYLIGKSIVMWFYLAMITTLPALALYVLGVSLSPDLSVVAETWDLPLRILASSIWLLVPTTALALCFSSLTSESRYAAFAWVALWVLGWVSYMTLSALGGGFLIDSQWSLLSVYHTLGRVQTWIFGLERDFNEVAASIMLLIIVTGGSLTLLFLRISSPMRV